MSGMKYSLHGAKGCFAQPTERIFTKNNRDAWDNVGMIIVISTVSCLSTNIRNNFEVTITSIFPILHFMLFGAVLFC